MQQANPVDVILSDWTMPGMSGVELCRRVRSRESAEFYTEAQSSNREGVADLAVDTSGRVVALCASDTGHGAGSEFLVRFNINGTLDKTFGDQGFARPWVSTVLMVPVAVRISPDGSVVTADYDPKGTGYVERFNNTGKRLWENVTNFGEGATDTTGALAVDSSNRIIVTGKSSRDNQGVVRLTKDGYYDTSFDSDGVVILNWSTPATGTGVAIDGSGRIVLTGNPLTGNTNAEILLARLSSTGVPDNSGGVYSISGTTGSPNDSWAIRVTSDGKYLVGGTTRVNGGYQFMVTRFLGTNYSWDPGFGSVGTVLTAFPEATNAKGIGLTVDVSNRPLMVGTLF